MKTVLVIGTEMQRGVTFRLGWCIFQPIAKVGKIGICRCAAEQLTAMKLKRIVRL